MDDKALARFMAKVKVNEANGCWEWTAYLSPDGYGYFGLTHGHIRASHRVSFAHFKHPIPDGLTIDHLCNNRSCANPDHLEAVTQAENNRRAGVRRNGICRKGHNKRELNPAWWKYSECWVCFRACQDKHLKNKRDKSALKKLLAS